jgi:hypothetical protein
MIVKTPEISDRFGLRFQREGRELDGKEKLVHLAEERFPQGLESVGGQQQVKFRLAAGV